MSIHLFLQPPQLWPCRVRIRSPRFRRSPLRPSRSWSRCPNAQPATQIRPGPPNHPRPPPAAPVTVTVIRRWRPAAAGRGRSRSAQLARGLFRDPRKSLGRGPGRNCGAPAKHSYAGGEGGALHRQGARRSFRSARSRRCSPRLRTCRRPSQLARLALTRGATTPRNISRGGRPHGSAILPAATRRRPSRASRPPTSFDRSSIRW